MVISTTVMTAARKQSPCRMKAAEGPVGKRIKQRIGMGKLLLVEAEQ